MTAFTFPVLLRPKDRPPVVKPIAPADGRVPKAIRRDGKIYIRDGLIDVATGLPCFHEVEVYDIA